MTVKEQTATQTTNRLEEIPFWGDRPPGQRIPPGDSCLHPGSTFKTRRAKQLAAGRGVKVFTRMKKSGRFARAAAYYVPADILAAVEAEVRATAADRAKNRQAAAKARAKAHVRELVRVADLIRSLFPAIPAGEAERVAAHPAGTSTELFVATWALHRPDQLRHLAPLRFSRPASPENGPFPFEVVSLKTSSSSARKSIA